MRYFSHDGQLRYARVDNSPLVVEGRTTGVLGIARDITEQKEERERAARADKLRALGQLASGVAHDFNNSLAAILGRAQLLRRQIDDPALVRNLDIIQTAAEDAAATVRRIQTFARKSPVKEFELVDVAQSAQRRGRDHRTRWENEARLRGLEYEVKLDAESGHNTYGSASELREVFVNLIVNAVDAMPRGGSSDYLSPQGRSIATAVQRQRHGNAGRRAAEDFRAVLFNERCAWHGSGLVSQLQHYRTTRRLDQCRFRARQRHSFTIDLPAVMAEIVVTRLSTAIGEVPSLQDSGR